VDELLAFAQAAVHGGDCQIFPAPQVPRVEDAESKIQELFMEPGVYSGRRKFQQGVIL